MCVPCQAYLIFSSDVNEVTTMTKDELHRRVGVRHAGNGAENKAGDLVELKNSLTSDQVLSRTSFAYSAKTISQVIGV